MCNQKMITLFTKQSNLEFTVILVYVDYLVLGGTETDEIKNIKTLLDAKFSIKDLGVLKYFIATLSIFSIVS